MNPLFRRSPRLHFYSRPIVSHGILPVQNRLPLACRFYSQKKKIRPENAPRIRYLFMVVLASFGLLHFVTTQVDKKAPKTTFTEREYQQYEKDSGLKRRTKLIGNDKRSQYKFYAIPFAHDQSVVVDRLKRSLSEGREVKIIDPSTLIQKELDEEGRYSYLLEELKSSGRSFPTGLLTALVKQEVKLFINTTKGQYDTDIIMVNYPQSTEEAIKFENDISDIDSCFLVKSDFDKNVSTDLSTEGVRQINNVIGYFDIVNKVKKL